MKWTPKIESGKRGDIVITKLFAWLPTTVNKTRQDTVGPKVTVWFESYYVEEKCVGWHTSFYDDQKLFWITINSFLTE